jgi:hypothetical protein
VERIAAVDPSEQFDDATQGLNDEISIKKGKRFSPDFSLHMYSDQHNTKSLYVNQTAGFVPAVRISTPVSVTLIGLIS